MLVIRLQRTGRKGHAQFRVVVQDSRRTPTSGKVVALLGTYDPHAKTVTLNKERAAHYLEHGAQPSERVVLLLKSEGIKLPKWVDDPAQRAGKIRNPEKLRRNRPAEPEAEQAAPAEPSEATAEAAELAPTDAATPEADAPEAENTEKAPEA